MFRSEQAAGPRCQAVHDIDAQKVHMEVPDGEVGLAVVVCSHQDGP